MSFHRYRALVSLLAVSIAGAACSSDPSRPSHPGANGGQTGGDGGSGGGSGGSSGAGGATGGSGGSMGGAGGSVTGGSGGAGGGGNGGGGAGGAGGSGGRDAGPAADGPAMTGDGGGLNPLPPGTKVVYILHDANAGASANDPSRKSLVDILNSMHDSHGIVVKLADSPTPAAMMPDAALIIVGPNAKMFEDHPAPDLKTTTVPVIVTKDGHTDEVGMGTVLNTPAMFDTIKIVKNDHPLAAGLPLGTVQVLTTTSAQRIIRFSNLGPDAIKIAVGPVDNNTYSIVAYEKGGMMANGFRAPAKRVGLFWHRPAAATADGAKLVKAAVDWILRP
jgi:hypothetical protein